MKKLLITSILIIGIFWVVPQVTHAQCVCDNYYGYGYDNYGYNDSWYNFGGYEQNHGWQTLPAYLLNGVGMWMQNQWYGNNYYDSYYGYDNYSNGYNDNYYNPYTYNDSYYGGYQGGYYQQTGYPGYYSY